ncbi:MAG: hypothetical protein K2K60_05795 [Clostridia bacterium]|nr:hypothetical protein [Clostridia bacterium]
MTAFPKSQKKTVDLLADGNALTVNCAVSDGILYPALSAVKCGDIPQGVMFAARAGGVGKFFICTPTQIYISDDGGSFTLLCAYSSDKPFLLEDMDGNVRRAMIVGGANAVIYSAGGAELKPFGTKLGCAAMHSGRIFGADAEDNLKLRWSDGCGADGWTEGLYGAGWLNLDAKFGGVQDIVSFNGSLVLMREYGLTVLTAGGAPETFSVKFSDLASDRIYKGTAAVAGGKLYFFTVSGLYSFDGNKIAKVKHNFSSDISAPVCAAAHGGRYFLSCHSKAIGGAVFCFDTQNDSAYLIDTGADGLCAADGIFAYAGGGAYKLTEGGSFYFTADFDFGTARKKTVTQIYIDCAGADIEISNGKLSRKFENASGIIRPNLRGKKFTVKVAAVSTVKKLTATAEAAIGI